jgi:hypothetical protein
MLSFSIFLSIVGALRALVLPLVPLLAVSLAVQGLVVALCLVISEILSFGSLRVFVVWPVLILVVVRTPVELGLLKMNAVFIEGL